MSQQQVRGVPETETHLEESAWRVERQVATLDDTLRVVHGELLPFWVIGSNY